MNRRIAIVSAGLSQPSSTRLLADQLGTASSNALAAQGIDAEITVIELRDLAHDITNKMLTGFGNAALNEANAALIEADAVIAVTPIFNASYSGLFKSFFDVLDEDTLAGKPILIGATGGSGRHSLALEHALRPLFSYLRAIVLPTAVYAATEDWGGSDHRGLMTRIERAGSELAELLGERRLRKAPDPFDEPTPFAELLGGSR
jgi:FMN reductase